MVKHNTSPYRVVSGCSETEDLEREGEREEGEEREGSKSLIIVIAACMHGGGCRRAEQNLSPNPSGAREKEIGRIGDAYLGIL